MRVVGSAAALVGVQVPGFGVVVPAGDLAVSVRIGVRSVAYALAQALVRLASAALRAGRPAFAASFVAIRSRPGPVPGASAVEGPQVPVPHVAAALEDPAVLAHEASDEGYGVPARHREVALPADPTAPRRARALLQDLAQEWGLDDDLHQDVAMVVTELVANAVDHAQTSSTVTIGLDDRGLLVTVRDGCADGAPRPRPVDPTAPRGRGLQMVDALAESWGVTPHPDGKTVWAVLRTS